ncbi:hypothetical protein B0H34DRAFT_413223 [Crassisporium funariophilum]|nr:hypothetical protein B0H34DRAFT_413223 [Crassisporium funariophilum]
MRFGGYFLVAAIACFSLSVASAPISCTPVSRELSGENPETKVYARLQPHELSAHIVSTLRGQAARISAQEKKKRLNKKVIQVPKIPKPAGYLALSQVDCKVVDTNIKKATERAKSQARKKAKADRTEFWKSKMPSNDAERKSRQAAKKAKKEANRIAGIPKGLAVTPPTKSKPKFKLSKQDKKDVSKALCDAAEKMDKTQNVPGRKDTYTVGTSSWSGKDVRKAIMNTYVHSPYPIGPKYRETPKQFRNDPYVPNHNDASLRGQRPLNAPQVNGAPPIFFEYPITKTPAGWQGTKGSPGTGRAITYHNGVNDVFHGVIGHDDSRGGVTGDHYLAQHQPHQAT